MKTLIAAVMTVAATVATAKDHVVFVNIAGAVEKGLFADVVTNGVLNVVQVRAAVYEEPDINVAHIVGLASMGYPKGERKISVYFVNTKDLPPQVTVPGFLAVINVRGLERDADAVVAAEGAPASEIFVGRLPVEEGAENHEVAEARAPGVVEQPVHGA